MTVQKAKPSKSQFLFAFEKMFIAFNKHVQTMNSSKLFAGLMIIILNVATKYVNLNLPKTVESYLKYTFSKQILVFAIAWMGTRDIYVALVITVIFILCIDFFFNEESPMCMLPESFTELYVEKMQTVTDDEIKKATEVLEKAAKEKATKEKATKEKETKAVEKDETKKYNGYIPQKGLSQPFF